MLFTQEFWRREVNMIRTQECFGEGKLVDFKTLITEK